MSGQSRAAALLAWADERFGPLGALRERRLGLPEPAWWYCAARLARFPAGNLFSPQPLTCAGASLDQREARWRALGEGVERDCALNAVPQGKQATLRRAGLAGRWPTCAPDEPCPATLRTPPLDTPITQVWARRLADDSGVLVPAATVYPTFQPPAGEPVVALPISSGLAFARDLATALWRGLCEVAERDAIMLMWWGKTPTPEIATTGAGVPARVADRVERLLAVGLRPRLFDITPDFRVPTVFCVVTGARYPCLVVGAGCHHDPAHACAKALDEAVALRAMLRDQPAPVQPPVVPGDVHRLLDHAVFYAGAPHHPAFDFLLGAGRPAPVSFAAFARQAWWPAPDDLPALARFAAARERDGLTVIWADLTLPEAAPFGRVVKVIVPEMVSLSEDHATRWLGTPRLLARAGLAAASAAHFNPYPHPFP
ncbi:MAG: YcaO-like family protein [Thermomicrobiales bacterium]